MLDIVIVGHICKDKLVLPQETWYITGGVPYYSGIAAVNLGNSIAIVTKLSREDIELLAPLKEKGIKLYPSFSEHTTGMRNEYPDPKNLDHRVSTLQSIGEPFCIGDIPELFPKIYHLGALLRGEIPYDVFTKIKERKEKENFKLSIDAQGFIRVGKVGEGLHYEFPVDNGSLAEFLKGVDILKVDRKEAEFLTGEKDFCMAARKLGLDVPEVVLTHNNGVIVYENNKIHQAKFCVKEIRGRTGRGDTCIISYLTYRVIKNCSAEESCNYAAALTSRKLGHPGPFESADTENLEELIKKIKL